MADSVEQLYKAQDLQEKLYPITKENAVKDNSNVSLDTKLTSINTSISNKVDKVTGKGLSTNDYTSAEKTKLAGIEAGAQVNVLEAVKINNTALPITDKAVNITIDSTVSETSTNAVQNKTIKSYVDTAKEEVKEDISNSVLENLTSGSSLKLYAQETLADQEFTYRQSPTEEDGLAKITDIKGNTLNWNQLVENGDFSESSGWTGQFATVTISNNVASVRQDRVGDYVALRKPNLQGLTGHKYLVFADVKSAKKTAIAFYLSNAYSSAYDIQANTRIVVHAIITVSNANTGGFNIYTNRNVELAEGDIVEFYHVMLFDLTQMGLDITDPSDFTSLFPLSYYSYNQGSLLSFNGNGIKTTPNIANVEYEQGAVNSSVARNTYESNKANNTTRIRVKNLIYNEDGKTYSLYFNSSLFDAVIQPYDSNGLSAPMVAPYDSWKTTSPIVFTATGSVAIAFRYKTSATITADAISQIKPIMYKQDDEFVLNLPISTYFPTGMKQAGNVYDEITESKAITRIGAVDLGSLNWTYDSSVPRFYSTSISSVAAKPSNDNTMANILCSKYATSAVSASSGGIYASGTDKLIAIGTTGTLNVKDSSYTDATAFKESLQGSYLYYELATPTETSFTTALEMRYPVYAGGTEQILPENSSIPTTAPIIADIEYSYDFKAVDRIIGMLNSVAQNETSPSTHNYSVGDYLVYKYQLYKVIASISTGASLTVGTNIQATTIMNELASLS